MSAVAQPEPFNLRRSLIELCGMTGETKAAIASSDEFGNDPITFDAPAEKCFNATGGYWSLFMLADYAGEIFPGRRVYVTWTK